MKKFLALVLALIMTMSLVTISAGAEFTDADEVTYDEAVDVMTALGIVTGDTSGAFNPTAGLTRGAAAKIICNMILGTDVASSLVASEAPYADVATSNVFAGYIAFCQEEGIISGYADGTFKPAAPLTSYAFLKMLLGALGYDADVEGFVGSNWAINVAKVAKQRNLTVGNDDYKGSNPITREEAMLYAFNTLKSEVVEYSGASNSTITIGDIVIKNNGVAEKQTGEFFYENNFAKLSLKGIVETTLVADEKGMLDFTANATDDFGRTSYGWYLEKTTPAVDAYSKANGDTLIGDYATVADYTVVVTGTKNDTVAEICKDLGVKEVVVAETVYGTGTVLELYTNTDGEVNKVVPMVTKLAKITKVTEAKGDDADFAYTVVFKVGTAVKSYKDTDLEGFKADTMVKDTYVLFTEGSSTAIVAEADVVTGKQTAYGSTYTKIDGAKLTFAGAYYAYDALNNTDTFDVYCDANGYVVGTVIAEEEDAEIQIFYVKEFKDEVATSFEADKAQAAVVYLDGSEAILNVNIYKVDGVKKVNLDGSDVNFSATVLTDKGAGFYAYTMNEAGEIKTLKKVDTTGTMVEDWKVLPATKSVTFAEKSAKVLFDTTALYATKDTVVVTLKDEKATTVTGYADFTTTSYAQDTNAVLYNVDGKNVLSVYVVGATAMNAVDDTVYGWYVETGDTYKKDGSNVTDVVYNVAGVDTTYTISGTSVSDSYKKLVAIDVASDGIASLSAAGTADAKLAQVDTEYVLLNDSDAPVYFADDVKFYDVTNVADNGVVALDELVKNSIVTYTVNAESPAEINNVYVTYAAQEDGAFFKPAAAYLQKVFGFNSTDSANAAANEDIVILQLTSPDVYSYAKLVMTDEDGTVDTTTGITVTFTKDNVEALMVDLTTAVSGFDKGEITYVIYVGTASDACNTAVAAGSFIWE